MSQLRPSRRGHLRRRRFLTAAAAAGVVPLAACDDVPLHGSGRTGGTAEGRADPDEDLLADAVQAEQRALAALQPLVDEAPARLRALLLSTVRIHRAHLELLDGAGDDPAPGPVVRRADVRRRLGQVASIEQALARRHAALAVRAGSGQFARVLAGMAAAGAQQADVWRDRGGVGG